MKIKKISAALAAALCAYFCIPGCTPSNNDEHSSSTPTIESSTSSDVSKKESSTDKSLPDSSSKEEKSEASVQTSSTAKSKITPAVWEATDNNGNSIYMMGTIHVADKDVETFPDYFEAAYAKCDALAVECDTLSSDISISTYSKLMYTDGTTIKDHVPEEQYNTAVKLLKDAGQYTEAFDYMKPVLWSSYIQVLAAQEAGLSPNYGVDSILLKRAKSENKEILELESVAFQNNLMADLSDDIQAMLFEDIANENSLENYKTVSSQLYENWKKGVYSEEIENSPESSEDEDYIKVSEEYNKIVVSDRNVNMVEKIESYIDSGKKVMVVAGAAHFYGDAGIIQLLKDDGYTIRQLSADDAKDYSAPEQSSEISETSVESSQIVENDPGVPRAA